MTPCIEVGKSQGVYSYRTIQDRHIRGPFAKFVDSLYHSESVLCGGAVTVSLSKHLPWQAMHFL